MAQKCRFSQVSGSMHALLSKCEDRCDEHYAHLPQLRGALSSRLSDRIGQFHIAHSNGLILARQTRVSGWEAEESLACSLLVKAFCSCADSCVTCMRRRKITSW